MESTSSSSSEQQQTETRERLWKAISDGDRKLALQLCHDSCQIDNLLDNDGNTALHYAARHRKIDFLPLLLNFGAKSFVSVKNHVTGMTSLMEAVKNGHLQSINYLLERGGGVNERNNAGLSSCHFLSNAESVLPLLIHNADFDAVSDSGMTVFDSIERSVNPQLVDYLRGARFVYSHLPLRPLIFLISRDKRGQILTRNFIFCFILFSWLHFWFFLENTIQQTTSPLLLHSLHFLTFLTLLLLIRCCWGRWIGGVGGENSNFGAKIEKNQLPPAGNERETLVKKLIGSKYDICLSCFIERPARVKHCSFCNGCFREFDHHCDIFGQCIDISNRRFFVFFLTLVLLLQPFYLLSCVYVELSEYGLSRRFVLTAVYCALHLRFFYLIFSLLMAQVTAISKGLTTHELNNWTKFAYLRDESGGNRMKNRCDRGLWNNWINFLSATPLSLNSENESQFP